MKLTLSKFRNRKDIKEGLIETINLFVNSKHYIVVQNQKKVKYTNFLRMHINERFLSKYTEQSSSDRIHELNQFRSKTRLLLAWLNEFIYLTIADIDLIEIGFKKNINKKALYTKLTSIDINNYPEIIQHYNKILIENEFYGYLSRLSLPFLEILRITNWATMSEVDVNQIELTIFQHKYNNIFTTPLKAINFIKEQIPFDYRNLIKIEAKKESSYSYILKPIDIDKIFVIGRLKGDF